MAILRMTHIGICVSDLDRSIRFYRDLLGFEYLSDLQVEGEATEKLLKLKDVKLHAVYLERDGTRIELLHYVSPGHQGDGGPRPMNALGLTHLSLRVDDLETVLADLRAAGTRILEDTRIRLTETKMASYTVLGLKNPGPRITLNQIDANGEMI